MSFLSSAGLSNSLANILSTPSMEVKVSWGFPSGVLRRFSTQYWADSQVAQNHSMASLLSTCHKRQIKVHQMIIIYIYTMYYYSVEIHTLLYSLRRVKRNNNKAKQIEYQYLKHLTLEIFKFLDRSCIINHRAILENRNKSIWFFNQIELIPHFHRCMLHQLNQREMLHLEHWCTVH